MDEACAVVIFHIVFEEDLAYGGVDDWLNVAFFGLLTGDIERMAYGVVNIAVVWGDSASSLSDSGGGHIDSSNDFLLF
jgi:hypothetical protein